MFVCLCVCVCTTGGTPHGRGGERSLAYDQDAKMREQHTEKLKNDLLV
jgi:hypothetical protein